MDKSKLTTEEIQIAVMHEFQFNRQSRFAVINSYGCGNMHECDVLALTNAMYGVEVEVKISKADIRADKKKEHGHWHPKVRNLYFAVGPELVEYALEHIPERAGLLVVMNKSRWVQQVRNPKPNTQAVKWTFAEENHVLRKFAFKEYQYKRKLEQLKNEIKRLKS